MYFLLKTQNHAYMHHHLVLFAFEFSKVGNLIPLENYLRKYQKGHIMLHINFSDLL